MSAIASTSRAHMQTSTSTSAKQITTRPKRVLLLETTLPTISLLTHLSLLRSPAGSPLYAVSALTSANASSETVAALEHLGVRPILLANADEEQVKREVGESDVVVNTMAGDETLKAVLQAIEEREHKENPVVYVHAVSPASPRTPRSPSLRTPSPASSPSSSPEFESLPSPHSPTRTSLFSPPPSPLFSTTHTIPAAADHTSTLLRSFALSPTFSSLNAHIAVLSHPSTSSSVGGPFNRLSLQIPSIIRSALIPSHQSDALVGEAHVQDLVVAYDTVREAMERDGLVVGPMAAVAMKLAARRERRRASADAGVAAPQGVRMRTGRRSSAIEAGMGVAGMELPRMIH